MIRRPPRSTLFSLHDALPISVTVVSAEEQLRGWLAEINRHQEVRKQIPAYDRLATLFTFFARWQIIRSEEHTSELQSHLNLVCRLLLEKKKRSKGDANLCRSC